MRCNLHTVSMICSPDAQNCEASGRQTEVNQLDERIATLQLNEQAQYATISSLETSLDNRHAHLSNLEARIAELEASGDPDLASLREMSQKQLEIASTLRQLISDNQGQAQARAKIIESQRQQLTARHRRNVLKQVCITSCDRCRSLKHTSVAPHQHHLHTDFESNICNLHVTTGSVLCT